VENLRNASPATVSRAGIIYVSASDLTWQPICDCWFQKRTDYGGNRGAEVDILKPLFDKWIGEAPPNAAAAVDLFDWCTRNIIKVMEANDSIIITYTLNLLAAQLVPLVEANEIASEDA
jgi:dynein heavy chain